MQNIDDIIVDVIKRKEKNLKEISETKKKLNYYENKEVFIEKELEDLKNYQEKKDKIDFTTSIIVGTLTFCYGISRMNTLSIDYDIFKEFVIYLIALPATFVGTCQITKIIMDKIIDINFGEGKCNKSFKELNEELIENKSYIRESIEKLNKEKEMSDLLDFIEDNIRYYSQLDNIDELVIQKDNKLSRKLEK